MSELAIAGMVVMALGCVTLGVLGTLAICYARTFIGKATKDDIQVKVGPDQDVKQSN
jgi:hypothetical protein